MTEQVQRLNEKIEIEFEMVKRDEAHTNSCHSYSGIWKYLDRSESKGDGHWEGTCQYCEKFYPHAKPNLLYAHLANNCNNVPEEWRHYFNYILINNLNDIPTDKPLNESNIIVNLSQKWKKAKAAINQPDQPDAEIDAPMIDKAITLAFVMCRIPFHVISNPFCKCIENP
ncbi:hypothetical protein C1646_670542 [Rhizophagus diaphanus]|nr:hypothetical protein C1646_670542 [Rhizophagus diaphanus] [Rhizophagus sp. MUCL 43196]